MLHLIPAPLHRAGLRLAHAVRLRWWRVARRRLNGCRVLVFDAAGQVLLVRHSYGSSNWMLPGGGMAKSEDPVGAARRELGEETGLTLGDARVCAVLDEPLYGSVNRVHLVCGTSHEMPRCDGREVIEARFVRPDALPPGTSPMVAARLAEWVMVARQARLATGN